VKAANPCPGLNHIGLNPPAHEVVEAVTVRGGIRGPHYTDENAISLIVSFPSTVWNLLPALAALALPHGGDYDAQRL